MRGQPLDFVNGEYVRRGPIVNRPKPKITTVFKRILGPNDRAVKDVTVSVLDREVRVYVIRDRKVRIAFRGRALGWTYALYVTEKGKAPRFFSDCDPDIGIERALVLAGILPEEV